MTGASIARSPRDSSSGGVRHETVERASDECGLGALADRLVEKALRLDVMADGAVRMPERFRLQGKAEGVRLALSFVEEMIRER